LALCYWADKQFEVDVGNTGHKLFKGVLNESALLSGIQSQSYSVVQLDHSGGTARLPSNINAAIYAFYRVERTIDKIGVFLVPVSQLRAAR
jgi:hypothetical protein